MKIKKKLIIAGLSLLAMIPLTEMNYPAHSIHSPVITANAKIKPYDDTVTNRIKRTGYYYDPVSKVTHYIKAGTPLYGGRYGDWYGDMEKGYSHDPYIKSYISGFVGSPKNTYWLVPDIAFKAPAKSSRRPKRIIHKAVKVRKPVKKPAKMSLKKFLKSHSKAYDKNYLAGFRKGFKDEIDYLDKNKNQLNRKRYTRPAVRNYHNYTHIKSAWGKPVYHTLNIYHPASENKFWTNFHSVKTAHNVYAYDMSIKGTDIADAYYTGSKIIIPKGRVLHGYFADDTDGFLLTKGKEESWTGKNDSQWIVNRYSKHPESNYWIARVK